MYYRFVKCVVFPSLFYEMVIEGGASTERSESPVSYLSGTSILDFECKLEDKAQESHEDTVCIDEEVCPICDFSTYIKDKFDAHVKHHMFSDFKESTATYQKVSFTDKSAKPKEASKTHIDKPPVPSKNVGSLIRECPVCDFKTTVERSFEFHVKFHIESYNAIATIKEEDIDPKTTNPALVSSELVSQEDFSNCDLKTEKDSKIEVSAQPDLEKPQLSEPEMNSIRPPNSSTLKDESIFYELCFCGFITNIKDRFKQHLKTHPPKIEAPVDVVKTEKENESCKICNFSTDHTETLKKHIKTHHLVTDIYSCALCIFDTKEETSLRSHIRTSHKEKKPKSLPEPLICHFCDFVSLNAKSLLSHQKLHLTKKNPFFCQKCKFISDTSSKLQKHQNNHQENFNCVICSLKTDNWYNFKVHMKHHIEKPYLCTYCSYRCRQKVHMKSHERRHTGEKPFSCTFCSYKCSSKAYMQIHIRTHTGEKPFKCDRCDYTCTGKNYLRLHYRRHTGEKCYKCQKCNYKTAFMSNLKNHRSRRNH